MTTMHGPNNLIANKPSVKSWPVSEQMPRMVDMSARQRIGSHNMGGDYLAPPCVVCHFGQKQNCIHPIPLYSYFFRGEQRACMHLCAINVSSGRCFAYITTIVDICPEIIQVIWKISDFVLKSTFKISACCGSTQILRPLFK